MISGTATSAPVTATSAGATPAGPSPKPGPPPTLKRNVTAPTITGQLKENGTSPASPDAVGPERELRLPVVLGRRCDATSAIPNRIKGKVLGASPEALRKPGARRLVWVALRHRLRKASGSSCPNCPRRRSSDARSSQRSPISSCGRRLTRRHDQLRERRLCAEH